MVPHPFQIFNTFNKLENIWTGNRNPENTDYERRRSVKYQVNLQEVFINENIGVYVLQSRRNS
jgi:hypothetical protein